MSALPKLSDLYNPKGIRGFDHKNGIRYVAGLDQNFQEYPKSIELWQEMTDGRIMLVKRWHKASITGYVFEQYY